MIVNGIISIYLLIYTNNINIAIWLVFLCFMSKEYIQFYWFDGMNILVIRYVLLHIQ